jgi:hypothetical protein
VVSPSPQGRQPSPLAPDVARHIDDLFAGKVVHRAILDAVIDLALTKPDVEVHATRAYVVLRTPVRGFASLQPRAKQWLDLALRLDGVAPTGRLEDTGKRNVSDPFKVRIRLRSAEEVDAEVATWLDRAYLGSV